MSLDDPALPAPLAARYDALAMLGRGGMGRVLRVRRRRDGLEFALKLMAEGSDGDGVSPERFRLEADLARRGLHPDLVGIVDSGRCDDASHYLVMELVPGATLRHRLTGRRPLARAEALEVAGRLANVLAALHDEGIVHRDLKPENVMLEPGGRVRLLDLGIARDTGRTAQLTAEGLMLGTPAFMAPEVCRGEAPGPAADVFALGVLLLDCLAPADPLPATARDRLALLAARAAGRELLTPHRGLDAPLRNLLARLMQPDPSQRPHDGRAAAAELGTVAAAPPAPGDDARTRRVPRPAPTPRPSSPRRGGRRVLGVMALAALVLVALRLRPLDAPRPAAPPPAAVVSDPARVAAYRSGLEAWLERPSLPLPRELRESGLARDGALQDLLYRRMERLYDVDLQRTSTDEGLRASGAAFLGLVDLAASAEPPPPSGTDLDGASAYFAVQYVRALAVREQVVTRNNVFDSAAAARSTAELARTQLLQVGLPRTRDLLRDVERLRERTTPRCRRIILDLPYATLLRACRLMTEAHEFIARHVRPCPADAPAARRLEAILWHLVAADVAASARDVRTQGEHAAAAMALAPRWRGEHMSLAERAALETGRDHVRSLLAEGREAEALRAAAALLEGRDDERYRPHLRLKLAEFWEHRGDLATAKRITAGEALQGP